MVEFKQKLTKLRTSRSAPALVFGIVFQIASATSSVAAPNPKNKTGNVTPAFCNKATTTVATVMNAALSTLTAAMVRAR